MIKYILNCNNKHEFESWFSESQEFEKLKKKKLIDYKKKFGIILYTSYIYVAIK